MAASFHEDFTGRAVEVRGSSNRVFGLVFAIVFAIAALAPLRTGGPVRRGALVIAIAFGLAALLRPGFLRPLNQAWTRLSWLTGRVFTPITTAVLFFVVFVPCGMIARVFRKDPLRLQYAPTQESYWISRSPQGALPGGMQKQF
jgi:hypothetical protein